MRTKLLYLGLFLSVAVLFVISDSVEALRVDDSCKRVEAIFARGSGAGTPEDDEARRFFSEWSKRVPNDKISQSTYALGTEKYNGYQYQHVDISDFWNGNALGAKATGGQGNDYGRSVDSGVGELKAYLAQRYEKCKSVGTFFVLGGYSQGAQVMGQALPQLSRELRNQIVFVALFGDPKLYFPEGEGFNPPACQGKEWSSYRRLLGSCDLDNGSLGSRKPYLPEDMALKTGLWCREKDFVCGTSYNPQDPGHGQYKNNDGDIDAAVHEAARRLADALSREDASVIDVKYHVIGAGTTGLDVVFVIDTTGSMESQIESAKTFARNAADKIQTLRGRVALVAYRDAGDDYTAEIVSGLSDDFTSFQAQLNSLTVGGGGDTPEAMLHGLKIAFDGLEWKNGATKAAVILTDAGFHNPDMVDGSTIDSIAKRSLEIDPVNVYPVVPSHVASNYTEIAEKTSGQVIINQGDTTAALTLALTKIENRPTGLLKLTEYSGEPGQEILFDASSSYVVDGAITKYEWDFDGDGVFEQTTTTPSATHTYVQKFDGTMQVRLTASNGTIANASAFVKIGTKVRPVLPKAPTDLNVTVLKTASGVSSIKLTWKKADNAAVLWNVRMNGIPLGTLTPDRTSLEITDVLRDKDVEFSIEGLLADRTPGAGASVILHQAEIAPSQPTTSWLTKLLDYIVQLLRNVKVGFYS